MAKTKKKNTVNRRAKRARKKRRKSPPKAVAAFINPAARFTDFIEEAGWTPLLILKFVLGLALIPVCWVSIETFFISFGHAATQGAFWRTPEFWFFGIGAVAWTIVFFSWRTRQMVWCYVAGHELTHAFFVLVCRGNVADIKISAEGGHILTNRNNFLISLSPYFFPFYTIVVLGLWSLAEFTFFNFTDEQRRILFALIGLSWAFHLTFTVWMIRREQPDVDQNGRLFSYVMIGLVNILVISSLLVAATPTVSARDFATAWFRNLSTFSQRLSESLSEIWAWLPFT